MLPGCYGLWVMSSDEAVNVRRVLRLLRSQLHATDCSRSRRSLQWHTYRVLQKKTAQGLMHHQFTTVQHRITRFSRKCSGKITLCQSTKNWHQLVKCSLKTAGIGYMLWAMSPCMRTWHLRQLKIDCKWRMDCWKCWIVGKMIIEFLAWQWKWHTHAVWYPTNNRVYWLS